MTSLQTELYVVAVCFGLLCSFGVLAYYFPAVYGNLNAQKEGMNERSESYQLVYEASYC